MNKYYDYILFPEFYWGL